MRRHAASAFAIAAVLGAVAPATASAAPPPQVVIVRLAGPSLSEVAPGARLALGIGDRSRLVTRGFGARLYRAQLARQQSSFARRLVAAVPGAVIVRRYAIVMNAVSVAVPAGGSGRIAALPGVLRVYPQIRYRPLDETVPALVGAPVVWGPQRASSGQGIKIGIIDDGVDSSSPFLSPAGLRAPPGFPRGQRRLTTAKVIVARSFAGPRSSRGDRLAFDPSVSEHGTHVAGIAAGRFGTTGHLYGLALTGLSGVAPEAYIGNYRGLDFSDSSGVSGSTDDIAAAVEAAVADGMDVLNLSLGGTQIDARSDALGVALEGAARAGVPAVVAGGNEFEELGYGSIGSPGSTDSAITVAAATTTRIFARLAKATADRPLPPELASFAAVSAIDPHLPRELSSPRLIVGASRAGLDEKACHRPSRHVPAGSLMLVDRGVCSFVLKAKHAAQAGAIGIVFVNNLPGTPFEIADPLAVPGVMIADSVGASLRAAIVAGPRVRIALGSTTRAVAVAPKVLASFSSSGPTPFDHLLKPDLSAPGVMVVSSLPQGKFAAWDGTSMASPAVAGAVALLRQQHPAWTPAQLKSALMLTAVPAFSDSAGAVEASTLREGAGFVSVGAATAAPISAVPASVDLGLAAPSTAVTRSVVVSDLQGGEGVWAVAVAPQLESSPGVTVTATSAIPIVTGSSAQLDVTATVDPAAPAGDATGFITLTRPGQTVRLPYWIGVERPALAAVAPIVLARPGTFRGTTGGKPSLVDRYRYPAYTALTPLPQHWAGGETVYRFDLARRAANLGATIESKAGVRPLLLTALDENRLAGESGLPLDVGPTLTGAPLPATGVIDAQPGSYFVVVDSATAATAGSYRLRLWVDDRSPPRAGRLRVRRTHAGVRLELPLLDDGSGVDPRWFECGLSRIGDSGSCGDVSFVGGRAIVHVPRLTRGATYALALQVGDYAESRDVLAVTQSPRHVTVVSAAFAVRADGSVKVLARAPRALAKLARGELASQTGG